MAASRPPLGDSHNFGRRVAIRGKRVYKPRPILWEWLMLSSDSPVREFLVRAAKHDCLGDGAFAFLPTLEFFDIDDALGGEVERIDLKPLPAPTAASRLELATVAGRSLALWSWLGVSDLHWENLALGVNRDGHVVFGPLDIEMMLAELGLPTETKLLGDPDPEVAEMVQHACGVRRLLPYLGKPVGGDVVATMVSSYRTLLDFLDGHAEELAGIFESVEGLPETPLRVLLRGTDEYVHAAQSRKNEAKLWPPLLDAERTQMARGDIPYFFRLYERPGIHFFLDEALETVATLPMSGDSPQLDPILDLRAGLKSPLRQRLREEGVLSILGAFDHDGLSGRHRSGELEIAFEPGRIAVRFADGDELETDRDLGHLVRSAYMPCTCGEVTTVLVPSVTRCNPDRSSPF